MKDIRAFALAVIPIICGSLWWMHEADSAHALRHAVIEDRVKHAEMSRAITADKMDGMARDIRGIMVAVGAERATREALHSQGK